MRLLVLTETYPPQRGGMAQSCDRLVAGFRSRGIACDVVHFTSQQKAPEPAMQQGGSYLPVTFSDSEAHTLNVAWPLLRKLPEPDVIMAFGGNLPVWAGPVYARWLQKPLLTCLRGNDFDMALFTPRKRDMLETALLHSQAVCVVSKEKVWKIKQLYPEVPVYFTPNGIDREEWKTTPGEEAFAQSWRSEYLQGRLCLGVFGQLKAKKGLGFLLDSLRMNPMREHLHFLLIGELGEDVQELLQNSQIAYTHEPFLDRYELLKYYRCCDGICIPSYYDGMPNVLLEAGALGIPVLATAADGMKDVLEPVLPELLFAVGDEHGCRKVIHRWQSASAEARKAWGDTLSQHLNEHYSHTLELEHYETILAHLHTSAAGPAAERLRKQQF